MAACNGDCTGIVGSTLDWFKIEQTNYNPITKIWPTTTLSQTLKYSFKIPNDIPSGQYLLRHELLALYSTGDVSSVLRGIIGEQLYVYALLD